MQGISCKSSKIRAWDLANEGEKMLRGLKEADERINGG